MRDSQPRANDGFEKNNPRRLLYDSTVAVRPGGCITNSPMEPT